MSCRLYLLRVTCFHRLKNSRIKWSKTMILGELIVSFIIGCFDSCWPNFFLLAQDFFVPFFKVFIS